ncbi:MAG TPA: nuclear transport factor 2 family protein [Sphingobium sp.]
MTSLNRADTALDRLFDALARGDVDGAVATLTPDARVWHGFDGIAHDREAIARDWTGFVGAFPERFVTDIRRQTTADGLVQQHLMVVRTAQGRRMAWAVCVVVRLEGDRIARLDEYIDRAGSFAIADDAPLTTPGMA